MWSQILSLRPTTAILWALLTPHTIKNTLEFQLRNVLFHFDLIYDDACMNQIVIMEYRLSSDFEIEEDDVQQPQSCEKFSDMLYGEFQGDESFVP